MPKIEALSYYLKISTRTPLADTYEFERAKQSADEHFDFDSEDEEWAVHFMSSFDEDRAWSEFRGGMLDDDIYRHQRESN